MSSASEGTLAAGVEGQSLARRALSRAIERQRLSHAYTFVGPRGVGKARFAEEFAAALLCREGVSREGVSRAAGREGTHACGACASCLRFASGNHPSYFVVRPEPGKLIEIDRIRETTLALALRARERRVVVIDDADRMGPPAANALLKTLEEPPPGTTFVLITSRPSQLLPTIHSRCHRVPFVPLTPEEFDAALSRLGLDPQAIPDLYTACGGAPGVAAHLVPAIEACGGLERFRELLDGVGAERPDALIDYVPEMGDEKKRDRIRRLLELVLEGGWSQRPRSQDPASDADLRQLAAGKALRIADLSLAVDGNLNPELALEALARELRSKRPPAPPRLPHI